MTKNKSIDGLAPRRSKISSTSVNADGFTPLMQPRKTQHATNIKVSSPSSSDLHPEEFIPPRKTTKDPHRELPEISNTPTSSPSSTTAAFISTSHSTTDVAAAEDPDSTSESSPEAVNEAFLGPLKALDFDEETGELMNTTTSDDSTAKKSTKSTKSQPPSKNSKKRRRKKRKLWLLLILIPLLILLAGGACFALWGNDLLARITGNQGSLMDLINETYDPLPTDSNGRVNVLLFGTSGFDMAGTGFQGEVYDGANLTDSIMVVSFNQTSGAATLISLPRDLKIDAGCNFTGKINEIYGCNNVDNVNETAGAVALTRTVSKILDLEIPYYAHLNWGSLQQIVDTLGGITVTLDEPVADYEYTQAVYEAGVPYTLNGTEALALARARHGTENGDFSRSAFQQKILLGIKDKILASNFSIPDLISLASTLGDNLRTNFSVSELKSLAHLATTVNWDNITTASFLEPEPLLTDGIINGISYVYPAAGIDDFSDIQAYLKTLLTDQTSSQAPGQDPSASTIDGINTESASILVLNSTGITGLASTEQAALETAGFSNIAVDNFSPTISTPYALYSFTTTAPTTQAALEQKYDVTAVSSPSAEIPRGYDFVLILGNQ